MSKYLANIRKDLEAYVPGEQPQDRKYIKLNTNESPFAPSAGVAEAVKAEAGKLQLYSDPESKALTAMAAELYGVSPDMVLMTNGSDEILNFAFMAFCGPDQGAAFPDITYGFYSVFGDLHHVPYEEIPLKEDFSIDYRDYCGKNKTIFIANPNAPTGLLMSNAEIEEILKSNPGNVVVIDEAYADFSGQTCLPLLKKYDNLLITRTFSKSYSMAGARLGLGIGNPELIRDLNTIKYSTNPYNVNRMTGAAGMAALRDNDYYMNNCRVICENRQFTKEKLESMGFEVLDSHSNFLFARNREVTGEELYQGLKAKGILVRHFNGERIKDFIRVTIGTREQMESFLSAATDILVSDIIDGRG